MGRGGRGGGEGRGWRGGLDSHFAPICSHQSSISGLSHVLRNFMTLCVCVSISTVQTTCSSDNGFRAREGPFARLFV